MPNLHPRRPGRWPLPVAIAAYLLAVFFIEYPLLQFTHGLQVYPWDATYLQMATAKSLAFDHTWNMNIGGLPASEMMKGAAAGNSINPNWQLTGQPGLVPVSLLYTWILALFFIVAGPLPGIPLLINLVTAMVLLRVIQRWLSRQQTPAMAQCGILLGVIFLAALPIRTAQGMEEILQALWVVLLVFGLANWLEKERALQAEAPAKKTQDLPGALLFYGMMVAATRYEGLLLIGAGALLLLAFRKWEAALQLAFGSVLPLLCLSLYYLHRDNHFIPYPQGWGTWGSRSAISGDGGGTALIGGTLLAIVIGLFFRRAAKANARYTYIQLLLAGTGLLQYFLTGSREATWLIAGIIPLTGVLCVQYFRDSRIDSPDTVPTAAAGRRKIAFTSIIILAILVQVLPLGLQSGQGFRDMSDACRRLYTQEYQMGRFLRSYYDREGTAVNDVAAAAYLTNGRKYAFGTGQGSVGQGSVSQASMGAGSTGGELSGAGQGQPLEWDTTASYLLDSLLVRERVRIAVVSGSQDNRIMLQDWIKIASWQTEPSTTPALPGSDVLLFYAYDTPDSVELKKRLQAFQPSLPPGVKVKYF